MSRCKSCNLRLESFDDLTMCKKCIKLSEDQDTNYIDPQHKLITDVGKSCVITSAKNSGEG